MMNFHTPTRPVVAMAIIALLAGWSVLACAPLSLLLPTHTPYPTLTPLPTHTLYPTLTPLATHTPYPTWTPEPTVTPRPTYTRYPTPTPKPTYTRYPTPTRTPRPTQSFADKWGVSPEGQLLDNPFVLVACHRGVSDRFTDSNQRYSTFTDDGDWDGKTVYARVYGAKAGAFAEGQCYRMAVTPMGETESFIGYLCGSSKTGCKFQNGKWWKDYWDATRLSYELVAPNAYERLTSAEYRQYRS